MERWVGIFNADFREFIEALNRCQVQYLLVGGYAVILHGYQRSTGDLDIWIKPTKENYLRLMQAFELFGLPLSAISLSHFLNTESYDVFTFGISPVSIDILTSVKGMEFDVCRVKAEKFEVEGTPIFVLDRDALLDSKRASGRFKDLADIEYLEEE